MTNKKNTVHKKADERETEKKQRYDFPLKRDLIPKRDLCSWRGDTERVPSFAEKPIFVSLVALTICRVAGSCALSAAKISAKDSCVGTVEQRDSCTRPAEMG